MRSIDPCPKCGGAKPHKGLKPDCGFAEPEPPEQGGEQLPFVMRSRGVLIIIHIFYPSFIICSSCNRSLKLLGKGYFSIIIES
jgi:hypothetical protein